MTPDDVKHLFEETGALLTGHFKLSSGLHSDRYLQCARVLQWPARAEALGAALGAALKPVLEGGGVDVVVSPAMGGLIIGQEVGRALSCRAIFAERLEGSFAFRRGLALSPGERVVVVEDVVTTAKSTREVVALVRAGQADVVACAAIVDRRGGAGARPGEPVDGLPFRALLSMDVETWAPDACPACLAGEAVVAPGSRFLAPAVREA